MPIQQLPLMKGVGKDFRNADYIDYLPVNMLATPKEILNSSGYLRSFPGIAKRSDVNGVSRGVEYNMAQNAVYRVCGGKLYKGESEVGDVAGSGRVSMAHGRTSQAVGVNGKLVEYRYDGTVKTVSNWPTDSGFTQYELGSVRDITRLRGRYAWSKDGTDSWFITDLEDESHPDRYSAQYRAESQPDGIIGIGTWRDFIVCFGSAEATGGLGSTATSNQLSAQESAESVFGRDLATDALITNGVKSLQSSSAKGLNGPAGFHSMIRALPESERVPAISSMLQDAISHGVRGGKADAAGINHIAEILTPQNVKAISRYSSELGRIADAYGTLARAAVKPQQYIERTGRTANVLRDLDAGLSNATSTVLNAIANSTSGAIVGGAGGGIAGAAAGALVGAGLKGAVSKIATTRSGRYAIEKAVQEATKAVRAGGSKEALAAAERRFMANKAAVKAIREALGNEEFQRLARAGIVASLSGMAQE